MDSFYPRWQNKIIFLILQIPFSFPLIYHSACLLLYTDNLYILNMISIIFILVLFAPDGPKDCPIHTHGIPPSMTSDQGLTSQWTRYGNEPMVMDALLDVT